VAHQPDRRHRVALRQPFDDGRDVRGPHAEAVHPGVDLEEDFERARQRGGLQHPHLVGMVHHGGQPARRDLRQFGGVEESLEQQDAARVVQRAQPHRRVELEQREPVGIGQRGEHPGEAVAVRVGLDHREHLCAGRARAHERQVSGERREVHLGIERSGHGARRVLRWK
jgi:hypothetical protein